MTRSERMERKLDRILELLGERVGVGMSDKDVVSYPEPPAVKPEMSERLVPRIASYSADEYAHWSGVTVAPAWAREEDK